MYRSLLRVSQDFKLWVLCFDDHTYNLLSAMALDKVELVSLEDFEDEDLKQAKKTRSLVEYFWTCTPSLPLYILRKYPELNMMTYIDADLYFYSDVSPIFEEFGSSSILLIEHRYAKDVEKKIKNNGLYNVQFITFRNDEAGMEALKWWRDRCIEWCYKRSEDGKMGDQKYLDDWTARFRNVCVLENKGAGLAPWNVIKYDIRQIENETYVDNDRLIFYHFHFFMMFSSTLFNLSIYELYEEHKKLIYAPYIKSMRETISFVKRFDKNFNKGYSSFRFGSIKDAIWTLLSFLRGNFLRSQDSCDGQNTTKRDSILCIVPLSPPITGTSYASEIIVNYLKERHDVMVISYERGNLISGKFSLMQLLKIVAIGIKLRYIRNKYNVVYLVNSSSSWGNMRDIFLLIMLGRRLRMKTVLHRHGSHFTKYINATLSWQKHLNKRLLGDVKNGIVLGESLRNIFDGYMPHNKIKIVNNCFSPDLLIPVGRLESKYKAIKKVSILFLSNLLREKGYELLLDAFLALPEDISCNAELHYAGEIYPSREKTSFQEKVRGRKNIYYHGPVTGEQKRELLWNAHIFCLPTFYQYEGQPISMLEAYAAGCIVLTTLQGGIKDTFVNNKNGLSLDVSFNTDLSTVIKVIRAELDNKLRSMIMGIDKYKHVAHFNREEALVKYTEQAYCENIEKILDDSELEEPISI